METNDNPKTLFSKITGIKNRYGTAVSDEQLIAKALMIVPGKYCQLLMSEQVHKGHNFTFAAMQTALLENGGDVAVAKANLIDLIQISFSYVADQLVSAMELAWETGEVEGQKLNPPEKARLKDNLETLKQGIELDQIPMLNEKELQSVLSAQDALAEKAEEVGVAFGQPATVLAICAMFIQSMLFANDGDVVAAKAHALRAMHQIWPVAIHTSQKLVEGAIAVAEDGPPEGRPN